MRAPVLPLLTLVLSGCVTSGWVTPVDAYRGYGDYRPERDRVVHKNANSATNPPDVSGVKFFQEHPPEGFEITSTGAHAKPGYDHVALGKFAYASGESVPKQVLVLRAKRIAAAAGGDAAVGFFISTNPSDYDHAEGIEAVVLKLGGPVGGLAGRLVGGSVPERDTSVVYAVFPVEITIEPKPTEPERTTLDEVFIGAMTEAGVRIVPPADLRALLSKKKAESYKACYDETCQIELGKQLAANAVVRTSITPLGEKCVVSAKVYDLKTETSLPGRTERTACSAESLADALELVGRALAK